jgi:hypothetical protein
MSASRLPASDPNLSEEYMNYASNLLLNDSVDGGYFSDLDAGYQAWGIVPESRVRYQSTQVSTIPQTTLDEGKQWTRFKADFIKSWDNSNGATQAQIDEVISCLDQEIPVAIGMWWPDPAIRTYTTIDGVDVMDVPSASEKWPANTNGRLKDGHSMVLVGYVPHSAAPGGGYFIFRNSWGKSWRDSGYSYMPYDYVKKYANDLVAYRLKDITSKGIGPNAAVAQANRIDVFVTDSKGEIHAAGWDQDIFRGRYRGWWSVRKGKSTSGSPVSVVARDPNKLDLFVTGADGTIYTAACDLKTASGQWRGWWPITTGAAAAGSPVTAVARDPNKLDAFVVGKDGGIYAAAWDANDDGGWRGWTRIADAKAKARTPITVVSRDPNKLDVFLVASDGKVLTAAWDQHVENGQWRGWWHIIEGLAPPGSGIAAVARDPNKLDIVSLGQNGHAYAAAWDANVEGGWRGWWGIG